MNKKNRNVNVSNNDVQNENKPETEIERAFVEDPLFRFFKEWQNVIFWGILILVGFYYGYNKYVDIRLNEQKEDADLFEEFRPIYANIVTLSKDIKQKELEIQKDQGENKDVEGKKKDLDNLKERLTKSLTEAESRIKPLASSKYYSTLSKLYSALIKKTGGDLKGFESEINEIDFNNYQSEKDERVRFYKELTNIVMAKTYLDEDSKVSEAKDLLIKLAKDGKYFNVVAYKTLSSILTGDENNELASLKEGILAKYPEQSELLKN